MCLVLDQFLWGHSSRVCDISCFKCYHKAKMYLFKEDHLLYRFFFQIIIFKVQAAEENPLKRIN